MGLETTWDAVTTLLGGVFQEYALGAPAGFEPLSTGTAGSLSLREKLFAIISAINEDDNVNPISAKDTIYVTESGTKVLEKIREANGKYLQYLEDDIQAMLLKVDHFQELVKMDGNTDRAALATEWDKENIISRDMDKVEKELREQLAEVRKLQAAGNNVLDSWTRAQFYALEEKIELAQGKATEVARGVYNISYAR